MIYYIYITVLQIYCSIFTDIIFKTIILLTTTIVLETKWNWSISYYIIFLLSRQFTRFFIPGQFNYILCAQTSVQISRAFSLFYLWLWIIDECPCFFFFFISNSYLVNWVSFQVVKKLSNFSEIWVSAILQN